MAKSSEEGRLQLILKIGVEIVRTAIFRQISLYFVGFLGFVCLLFGLVYWQAENYEVTQATRFLEGRLVALEATDVDEMLAALTRDRVDPGSSPASFGLFDAHGGHIVGDLAKLPGHLPLNGQAHILTLPDERHSSWPGIYAAAARLADGRILVIQRDLRQMAEIRNAILRALVVGILPALLLSIAVGLVLGYRTLRRARSLHRKVDRIVRGNLDERLPKTDAADDFDKLAGSINNMLDLMGDLLAEIRGVGDDIAHDLRTPLTRVRTRLERGVRMSRSKVELDETVDAAIVGLDQAIGITTSLLRITEIEDGQRRTAFAALDLRTLAADLFELYEPIAEARQVTLELVTQQSLPIIGDRDLLMEAASNIVDNAIKFTPPGRTVSVATLSREGAPIFRVTDTGPGIPAEEREAVMRRFYRADKSRHLPGSGLGLGVVAAVAKLHGFAVSIGGDQSGCIFEIRCAPPVTTRYAKDPPFAAH